MKLWLISQDENDDYGTYDSAVVAAETEDQAKAISPSEGWPYPLSGWTTVDNVQCEYVGEAKEGTTAGEICSSYNAD